MVIIVVSGIVIEEDGSITIYYKYSLKYSVIFVIKCALSMP